MKSRLIASFLLPFLPAALPGNMVQKLGEYEEHKLVIYKYLDSFHFLKTYLDVHQTT